MVQELGVLAKERPERANTCKDPLKNNYEGISYFFSCATLGMDFFSPDSLDYTPGSMSVLAMIRNLVGNETQFNNLFVPLFENPQDENLWCEVGDNYFDQIASAGVYLAAKRLPAHRL
jgi:hypothetical protein